MPQYRAILKYRGDIEDYTTRTFVGDFADDATATAAIGTLVTAAQAITSAAIYEAELTKVLEYASTPTANAMVFNTASLTTRKEDGGLHNMSLPAVAPAIMSGNSVQDVAALQTFLDEFETGGTGWMVSDGETLDATNPFVSGKRVIVRSGTTNLK